MKKIITDILAGFFILDIVFMLVLLSVLVIKFMIKKIINRKVWFDGVFNTPVKDEVILNNEAFPNDVEFKEFMKGLESLGIKEVKNDKN